MAIPGRSALFLWGGGGGVDLGERIVGTETGRSDGGETAVRLLCMRE